PREMVTPLRPGNAPRLAGAAAKLGRRSGLRVGCRRRGTALPSRAKIGVDARMGDVKPLMAGKRGLVMGVANDRSLAWGIARAVHAQGGELAFSYQGEALEKRVRPLAQSVGSEFLVECDVTNEESVARVFSSLAERWQRLDFVVHAIAFSDKE